MPKKPYIPIENNPSLMKDTRNGAIINMNESGYKAALKRREKQKETDKMKADIDELKTMVKLILKNLDK